MHRKLAHYRYVLLYLFRFVVLGDEPVNPQNGVNPAGQDDQAKPRAPARTDGIDGFLYIFYGSTTRTFAIFEVSGLRTKT